jgi:hypothetical protein
MDNRAHVTAHRISRIDILYGQRIDATQMMLPAFIGERSDADA